MVGLLAKLVVSNGYWLVVMVRVVLLYPVKYSVAELVGCRALGAQLVWPGFFPLTSGLSDAETGGVQLSSQHYHVPRFEWYSCCFEVLSSLGCMLWFRLKDRTVVLPGRGRRRQGLGK